MPDIVYGSVELASCLAACRLSLSGTTFMVEAPRALSHALEEPFSTGAYHSQNGVVMFMAHDPEGTVRWGRTIYDGDRIKAIFVRADVKDLKSSDLSDVEFAPGTPGRVSHSLNRLEFLLLPKIYVRKVKRSVQHKSLNWPTRVLVENTVGKEHPIIDPNWRTPAEVSDLAEPSGSFRRWRVRVSLENVKNPADKIAWIEGVQARTSGEASTLATVLAEKENPGYEVREVKFTPVQG